MMLVVVSAQTWVALEQAWIAVGVELLELGRGRALQQWLGDELLTASAGSWLLPEILFRQCS